LRQVDLRLKSIPHLALIPIEHRHVEQPQIRARFEPFAVALAQTDARRRPLIPRQSGRRR
jgi:hypothetical protein